jgi:hypothetical protein
MGLLGEFLSLLLSLSLDLSLLLNEGLLAILSLDGLVLYLTFHLGNHLTLILDKRFFFLLLLLKSLELGLKSLLFSFDSLGFSAGNILFSFEEIFELLLFVDGLLSGGLSFLQFKLILLLSLYLFLFDHILLNLCFSIFSSNGSHLVVELIIYRFQVRVFLFQFFILRL